MTDLAEGQTAPAGAKRPFPAPKTNGRIEPGKDWPIICTLFLSAALMFMIENMVAKTLLPVLGGAPAVWNICTCFFQSMLLAGYGYAHLLSTAAPHTQSRIHALVLLVSALTLPITLSDRGREALSSATVPEWTLIGVLLVMVGMPFFVLSATSPLLQHWYTRKVQDGEKAYRLYAASNSGSLLGLLAYPVLIEPTTTMPQQNAVWTAAYAVLILLVGAAALQARKAPPITGHRLPVSSPCRAAPGWRTKLEWAILAAVPSSLMLGVTSYITSDIAAVPLLWTIPLSIYLGTLMVVFGQRTERQKRLSQAATPVLVVAMVFLTCTRATEPSLIIVLVHLLLFASLSLECHGRLVDKKPTATYLTQYYLIFSAGGVAGSLFNSLIAPRGFKTPLEYPIAIVIALLIISGGLGQQAKRQVTLGAALITGIAALLWLGRQWPSGTINLLMAVVVLGLYGLKYQKTAFACCTGLTLWLAAAALPDPRGRTLFVDRDFFGVSKVTLNPAGTLHQITHGNTIHGTQFVDPARKFMPTLYYHQQGPFGAVFEMLRLEQKPRSIAIAGMGAGTLLAYSRPNQEWTIYEIDPIVVRIANNQNLFSYIQDAPIRPKTILGDARLMLAKADDGAYDALIIDVFSSDAIPTHLLTEEAGRLYLSKLRDSGLLVIHISNRSLNLLPVVTGLAAKLGATCYSWSDTTIRPDDEREARAPSNVCVLTPPGKRIAAMEADRRWVREKGDARNRWTDDFSNIVRLLK
jgi:hypothetical protein